MRRLVPLLAAVALACTEAEDDPASFFEADPALALTTVPPSYGGCGDVELYAHDATDTHAIFLGASGFATDAHLQGGPITYRARFPDPEVFLRAQLGRRLTSATCVGAFPQPGPRVDRQWVAQAGVVDVRVTPDPAGSPSLPLATAEAWIRDVRFVDAATGASFRMRDVRLPPVEVGLYPP